ncbi:MAG TPA: AraC family transcriptional regulator [Verrucomicrobiae bacterium]|jgi:AraC-like DNA-binding protein|nr:AraC family transcriptional regulator [Verrucomicrobiae bacterium]
MTDLVTAKSKRSARERSAPDFSETQVWKPFGHGWRKLHGGFRDAGYSVEWHDFTATNPLDWSKTFHPGSLEICLNLSGHAEVRSATETLELGPLMAGFYAQNGSSLIATRQGGERHQFITIELSLPFLERHIVAGEGGLHPRLSRFLSRRERAPAMVSDAIRLSHEQQQLVSSLRTPPVFQAAQRLWSQAKALEVVAAFLYQPLAGEELFCERQHHLSRERVQKVLAILKEDLAQPPGLEELGRRVGCSHFYLSRIFTQEVGKTISVTLRDLRMERAASLLREGRLNVTQVALEVGYSSLSHFSGAFREVIGCCPGLYPLAPVGRKT